MPLTFLSWFLFATLAWGANLSSVDLLTGKTATLELATKTPQLGTVVVFMSAACPCSISHQDRLKDLKNRFAGFKFTAVVSGEDQSVAQTHFKEVALGFPVLYDAKSELANHFGALKTPHVFVLSPGGEIVYRGGVDDSHDANRAKKMYLEAALGAMVAGNRPTPSETKPLGCRIEH